MNLYNTVKRWFGGATAYQPGSGRILPVNYGTGSGVLINEQTALGIPGLFHALRLYGQTIGYQKWDVIKHNGKGGIDIAKNHPVHQLLHHRPNEFQSSAEWRSLMIAHRFTYGNGYSYIERNGNMRPTALLPLLPDRTKPQMKNGVFNYLTVVNGEQVILEPYEVFHIKGFSMDGIVGLPLIQIMKDTLGLSKAESDFAARFFGSGANMGGVVEVPGSLSDTARQNLKTSMGREFSGLSNAFKTLFLEEGMKYVKLGVEPDKAQFIEGRQFSLGELARVTGLAPHLLYDLSKSTNNNIEHQGIEAVTYSFAPVASALCDEANCKLLYESEKDEYETRIDLKPLMAGDAKTQAEKDQIRFNCLAITPNEIRAKDGLNPIEGGDNLFITLPISVCKGPWPLP